MKIVFLNRQRRHFSPPERNLLIARCSYLRSSLALCLVLQGAGELVTHYSAFNLLPVCKCQPDPEYNLRLQSEEIYSTFILRTAAECEFFWVFFARAPVHVSILLLLFQPTASDSH